MKKLEMMRAYNPSHICKVELKSDFEYIVDNNHVIDFDGCLGANVIGQNSAYKHMHSISMIPMTSPAIQQEYENTCRFNIEKYLYKLGLKDYTVQGFGLTGSNLIEQLWYDSENLYTIDGEFHGKTPMKTLKHTCEKDIIKLENTTIIFEPVKGGMGQVVTHDGEYFDRLKTAQNNGCTIVADEIQFGLYHTGELFSYMNYNIKPDVILCGKAFGFPLPFSMILSKKPLVSNWSSTYQYYGYGMQQCCKNLSHVVNHISQKEIKYKKDVIKSLSIDIGIKSKNLAGCSFSFETHKVFEDFIKGGLLLRPYHGAEGKYVKAHISPLMDGNIFNIGVDRLCKILDR